jgi:murein DD-endopeptidase MepM/ murein hydrolase activator NlpD
LNSKCVSASLIFLLGPVIAWAQFSASASTVDSSNSGGAARQEYLFPIAPGVTNTLAGTMGELRGTHFHSGLDIRTNNMVGAAVLAVQKGYISRIVKSSYSYGNVIFITHPDSNTTLYAHLDQFKGKIAEHVRNEQYRNQTFEIDLRFNSGEFPVNRGDTIALSGNTGSSNGPHLHFDIRDKDMNALNPLQFGFEEIPDKTKPLVQRIALRTMDINSRINGKYGRFEFHALKVGADYVLPQPILTIGKIGVEVLAYDKMDNSRFQCGINTIEMEVDSQRVFRQYIDKITMPVTRGILSLFDYKTYELSSFRFNKLFVQDGNPLDFYDGTVNRGVIAMKEKDLPVHITLADTYGNTTHIRFALKKDKAPEKALLLNHNAKPFSYSINENILQLTGKVCKDTAARFFVSDQVMPIKAAYKSSTTQQFLFDLRKSIPDSIQVCGEKINLQIKDIVPSGTEYTYYSKDLMVFFPDSALFDTLYFALSKKTTAKRETIQVGDRFVPLMRDIKIDWKPVNQYDSQKYSVYRVEGPSRYTNVGGKWENGTVKFVTREFGEFTILPDSIPPSIFKIACNQTYARFRVLDDLSGLYSFEASVDGKWLLMNYDYKTGILMSERLDRKIPLKGDFELKVRDYSGNEKVYKQKIL